MKHLTIFILLFFMIPAATTAFAGQAKTNTSNLVIHITGFENSNGIAKVVLVNSKKNYNKETPFKGYNFNIINNRVIKNITLPYGEYAIKVYHDENGNHELDTRIFGIPVERYGFSNNARGTFGPPEYEEALFNLNSPKKEITITLQ
ncbi:MAG: DUF2141 domain-containing protein [Desulfobacula sp.]|uniref:DUF2141 domain-containing protein n=1 Tax=Desulfobacula sp. TaxID=2593537 RepID=UPI0025C6744A|nr:DUF2141 domain-containing protein [Desulfobacula sp.]MCD4719336.1 DUF2141 domain-containing protein [Desulfobacula sp.]